MKPFLITLATALTAVGAWSILTLTTQAAPKLLPFQCRLTDASDTPVAEDSKVVQLKIYDAPTGGAAVWKKRRSPETSSTATLSTL